MSEVIKTRKEAFASRAQRINIYLLILSLLMLAQDSFYTIYTWGFRLLGVVVILQISLGNIDPSWGFKKTAKKTVIITLIIVVIFMISIFVTPYLIELGRPKRSY
jgi:hypothetical protein